MKKWLYIIGIASALLVLYSCGDPRYLTIGTRLDIPLYNRPLSPGDGYIWIEGEWFWNGGDYAWRNGYWARPLPRYNWMPGDWKRRGDGWYWRPGNWRR